ncbi:MFS transporter [Microbispora sp. NPDC046973]|uniref:MFS transporter n=1 Tax=Microbispora sp. NPDC046973 TaxID=3155022 RepID=UPI0033E5592F
MGREGYLLALAVGLALTSFLARRFGLVPTYIGSLALFALASAACALSPDAGALICCRALQGLGGAPLVPLAIGLLIGEGGAVTGSGRGVPLAAGLAFFAAPALGVSLGGLLIGAYGWRSIFLINLPIGLLALPGAFAAHRAGLGVRGDRAVRPDLVVLFAVLFLAPLYLQTIQHHSSVVTGLALLPQGLTMGLSAPLGDRVAERRSARFAVVLGMVLLTAMTGLMALFTPDTPVWLTTLVLCGRGLAIGFTSQPLVVSLLGGLAPERVPDANTLFSVAQRLAGSFGIALLVTFFTTRGAATGSPLTGFRETALVLAATALLGTLGAAMLRLTRAAEGRVRPDSA